MRIAQKESRMTKVVRAQASSIISETEFAKRVEEAQVGNVSSGTKVGSVFASSLCFCVASSPFFVIATELASYRLV